MESRRPYETASIDREDLVWLVGTVASQFGLPFDYKPPFTCAALPYNLSGNCQLDCASPPQNLRGADKELRAGGRKLHSIANLLRCAANILRTSAKVLRIAASTLRSTARLLRTLGLELAHRFALERELEA